MQGLIKDSVMARKLGYYIFWNLRHEQSGLAVEESEVREAAARAGIRHVDTAWELFDRNCDQSATLEEIVGSVETVRFKAYPLLPLSVGICALYSPTIPEPY